LLFSRKPKLRREDFYDREDELRLLSKGIEAGEGLIVVYGVRRIGKTSLVYVGLTELDIPFIPIDLRKYSEDVTLLSPIVIGQVINEVLREYEKFTGKVKNFIERIIEHIEALDILKIIGVKPRRKSRRKLLTSILEKADKWAKKRGTRIAIVLDEAQELRRIPAWRNILAWAIEHLENVTFIVTGSEVGVLRDFLKLEDASSPLFGRARLEISLSKFTREQSIDFLKRGFNEARLNVRDEEIEDSVNKLNGIVGWLALYGYYRVTYGVNHREAISKIEAEAIDIITKEVEKAISSSPTRYLAILWAISLGLKSWSTIKHFVEGVVGEIPDNRFNRLLQNLVKYGFVEKTKNLEYRIIDPLLPKAIEILRKRYRL